VADRLGRHEGVDGGVSQTQSPGGSQFHSFEDVRSYPVHVSAHKVFEHVKKCVTCCRSRLSESYSNFLLYEIT